jgi:hypothetical protein
LLATDGFGIRSKLIEVFGELPADIVAALGDLSMVLWNAGGALIDGLFDGIRNNFWAGIDAVKSLIDPRNWDIPGRSPLLEAMEHTGRDAGEGFVEGLVQGMVNNQVALMSASTGLVHAVWNRITQDWEEVAHQPIPFELSAPSVAGSGEVKPDYVYGSTMPGATGDAVRGAHDGYANLNPGYDFGGQWINGKFYANTDPNPALSNPNNRFTGGAADPAFLQLMLDIANRPIVIQVDGATIAEAVNKENGRAY